ncbi:type IV pili methyl-accepting chemotaxis transducer N-terminal domain-containing protein [Ectothiorhodospiraceae bacterium WFHF3C12]|nr:type IV pili methyl-accepting chemotaxis transducer N-terminal domain-containing protein [Ectothiorhodospiraceae bacterium WFHF3C12]
MVVSFWWVAHYGNYDRQYIRAADSVRVLSQTIAKNASEAANGKTDAFALLERSKERTEEEINLLINGRQEGEEGYLPATAEMSEEAQRALQKVLRPWERVKANTETILERQDMVITVNELAESFRVNVPRVQSMLDEAAGRLVATNGRRDQVYYASRGQLYAERIGRHLGEMLRGGIGNITAADRLGRAEGQLQEALNALLNGSNSMNLPAVSDGTARSRLSEAQSVFEGMSQEVDQVLERSPELYRVRDAADLIYNDSEQMLATAAYLSEVYAGMSENRLVQDWFGFAFGALALVLLLLRAWVSNRMNRAEIEAKEEEKRSADEQTQKNQEAILNLLDEIEGLKEGDLTVNASVGEEITGAIGDAFNDAIDALRNLVLTINETSVQVSSAAQQTQATAMHLAEASDHQAHQITAASAAVNEMAVSIDQVSKNAEESASVAQQSVDLALKGADTVQRTIDGMDSIREQIQETSKRIKRLGESSQEIGNIVELINDIADQTNILALNASIQAAMAGESGRGFAVVADEVQRLAERSGNATKQIEALVKTIQTDTNEAVISMEQSTAGVVSGAKQAEEAGEALREIESVSKQLAGLIQNISEASRQQANAAANISDTMNVIQEITSQTSAGTNETATSIGNLADLANDLRNSVAGFKLPE